MNMRNGMQFIKSLLGKGRYSFNLAEAAEAIGLRGQALNMNLQRLKRNGWIVSFSQGFYLVLDPQHQPAGILDPEWFVDDWAAFLGTRYYVGGLSAAAVHGAAHQRPVTFQVFMDRRMRPVTHGGLRVDVFYKRNIPAASLERKKCQAGYFLASNPELTAYDLVAYPRCCPSLDQVATVYAEMGESVRPDRLAALLPQGCRMAPLQRVGWFLDRAGWREKTDLLHGCVAGARAVWRPLDSRLPVTGEKDDRWKIVRNTSIEPDIEP